MLSSESQSPKREKAGRETKAMLYDAVGAHQHLSVVEIVAFFIDPSGPAWFEPYRAMSIMRPRHAYQQATRARSECCRRTPPLQVRFSNTGANTSRTTSSDIVRNTNGVGRIMCLPCGRACRPSQWQIRRPDNRDQSLLPLDKPL